MTIKPGDFVLAAEAVRLNLPREENRRYAYRVLSVEVEEETSPLGKPARFLRLQHVQGSADFAFTAFEGYYHLWKPREEVLAERLMS
jgi:hypothetical protein